MDSFEEPAAESFEDLFETAPCGYVSLDPKGRIALVNGTLSAWLGRGKDQLLGMRLRDLLNVPGAIFYETHFAPLLRMQGYFNEVALDLVMASGEKLPVLANAAERRNEQGELLFTRITLFQAVHRRRFERELVDTQKAEQETRSQLQELNSTLQSRIVHEAELSAFREQFIAVLGHDMRNPVAAVDAGVKMLMRDGWTDRSDRILRLMLSSVARMNGLIDNVMDLARARLGGGIPLQIEPGRPTRPTVEQVVDEIRSANPDRKVEAIYDIDDSVPLDHLRVAQMFSNLLANAITHGAPDEAVRVQCTVNAGRLAFSVANGGAAISANVLEGLFKPFRRGDVSDSSEGLGLGLYIASQIAEAHGGKIEVRSTDFETKFTFHM